MTKLKNNESLGQEAGGFSTRNYLEQGVSLVMNLFSGNDGTRKRGNFTYDCYSRMARFEEFAYGPRKRIRSKRIFRNGRTLLMRRPDGRYVLTTEFEWTGTSTWDALRSICQEVYRTLKNN